MPFTCSKCILHSICFHLPLSSQSFFFVELSTYESMMDSKTPPNIIHSFHCHFFNFTFIYCLLYVQHSFKLSFPSGRWVFHLPTLPCVTTWWSVCQLLAFKYVWTSAFVIEDPESFTFWYKRWNQTKTVLDSRGQSSWLKCGFYEVNNCRTLL